MFEMKYYKIKFLRIINDYSLIKNKYFSINIKKL